MIKPVVVFSISVESINFIQYMEAEIPERVSQPEVSNTHGAKKLKYAACFRRMCGIMIPNILNICRFLLENLTTSYQGISSIFSNNSFLATSKNFEKNSLFNAQASISFSLLTNKCYTKFYKICHISFVKC